MKTFCIFLLIFTCTWITPQRIFAQRATVNFQIFYDGLSPYGSWMESNEYGYVWVPNVSSGFIPYSTNGYWIYTNEGWTWVSDYPWGWAPFHYGRWYTDAAYGPTWVPDNQWGPGWVNWRSSNDYYGWAPMRPGIGINLGLENNDWTFVRSRNLGRSNIHNYYIKPSNNVTIIRNTSIINNHKLSQSNTSYSSGPDIHDVEKHVGKSITPVTIKDDNRPGQSISKNQLHIYRPTIEKNVTGSKPVPSNVKKNFEVKTMPQKSMGSVSPKKQVSSNRHPVVQQHINASVKQPLQSQQHNKLPNNHHPIVQQYTNAPAKQPAQPQHNRQPNNHPVVQQPQRTNTPVKQPTQPQHNRQPNNHPAMQQQQHTNVPAQQPQHRNLPTMILL